MVKTVALILNEWVGTRQNESSYMRISASKKRFSTVNGNTLIIPPETTKKEKE